MLNRVHWLQRQAEKSTRKGRFEEAIQHHREASDLLEKLLNQIVQTKALESLKLQQEFHLKEEKLLNQYQKRIELIEQGLLQIRAMGDHQPAQGGEELKSPDDYGFKQLKPTGVTPDILQKDIFKKFEETESLLEQLSLENKHAKQQSPMSASVSTREAVEGTKKPKDDRTIIEELQVANSHLRNMVDSLFVELVDCQRKNEQLENKIRDLEKELQQAVIDNRPEFKLPPLEVPNYDIDLTK